MADDITRRQMLAAMLAAPAAGADEDKPDTDVLPVPQTGPYVPLVNRPPPRPDYTPPLGPPPWTKPAPWSGSGIPPNQQLAMALGGGAALSAPSPPAAATAAPAGTHYAQLPGPPLLLPGAEGADASISPGMGSSGPSANPLAALGRAIGIGGPPPPLPTPAPTASQLAQNVPPGRASDVSQGDPTMEAYRAQHDSSVAAYNRAISMAEQTAGSPSSAVYLKIAEEAAKAANDVNMKAIEHGNKLTRAPNAEEAARIRAANQDPTKYQFTGGKAELIPTEKEDKSKSLQKIGQDQYGNEQYGVFDKTTGEIVPYKPPAGAGTTATAPAGEVETDTAPAGQPVGPLPPDQIAKIQTLPIAAQGHVRAILEGRETMPKLPVGGRVNPINQMITQGVFAVNPTFDAANNITQVAVRKTYAPSGNNNAPGTLIQNGDAALDHLVQLKEASDKLENYGSIGGSLVSGAAAATGGYLGHDYSAHRAELDTKAQIASAEAIKYLAGATGGGEMERDRLMHQFSSANPPDSRLAAIRGLAQDILEKKVELQEGWRRSMGPNTPDFEVISPNSVGSVNKLGLGSYLPMLGGSAAKAQNSAAAAVPASTPGAPAPGFVKGGYRFKGGDPGQKNNWEHVP